MRGFNCKIDMFRCNHANGILLNCNQLQFVNLAGQGEEGPLGRQVNPKELNVIGKCGPPFDVLLCSYFATSGACATEPAADR